MNIAVVDTNVVSYIFRGESLGDDYLTMLEGFTHQIVSFITVQELSYWSLVKNWGNVRRTALDALLGRFGVYHSDEPLCLQCARVMHGLRVTGKVIGGSDAWIAATALQLDATLITHNAKDFRDVPSLRMLTLVR